MQQEDAGFFKTLFDWDFKEFLTIRFVKWSYIVWVGLTAIYIVIGEYVSARNFSGGERILFIVGIPFVGLLFLIYIRIALELTFVFFRIERHLRKMADNE